MKPDPDAETQMFMNAVGVLCVVCLAGLALGFIFVGFRNNVTADAYRQLTTGQATVISYTVPGSGVCRAVLVDGKRHGETCEGEE